MAASPTARARRRAPLRVNPEYRDFLEQRGLTTPAGFLALTGVIVSGHPDRHVLRVTLGSGPETITAFLKREHRVAWRSRLANYWAGFGFVSHSCREAQVLRQLARAGVPGPDWLAAGEDGDGRAFLLVRELAGAVELRQFLQGQRDDRRRRRLARKLGEALAHAHDSGFDHPDLYAKHVLVDPRDLGVSFLDWQRSRRRPDVDWPRRFRDLAALHASLADDLATPRERCACLRAYLRATVPGKVARPFRRRVIDQVRRRSGAMLRHRHVREQRQACLSVGAQRLIWLDGEALCVTPELNAALGRQPPSWLAAQGLTPAHRWQQATVTVPGAPQAVLVRRRARWSLRWLWNWLRGKHLMSRELRQAGLLFRLQRCGVGTPRLLAFGQKHYPPRRTESFLLTEPPPGAVALADWLRARAGQPLWTAQHKQRRRLVREAAGVLQRMHEARCYLGRPAAGLPLRVREQAYCSPSVVLASVDGVRARRRASSRRAADDLAFLFGSLPRDAFHRTDALRFLLAYVGAPCLTADARRLAAAVLRRGRPSLLELFARWLSRPAGGGAA